MRILSERNRASAAMKTEALSRLFGCRRVYVLPMSVKPDKAMLNRYAEKMKHFEGHTVLTWCTHGERTAMLAAKMSEMKQRWHVLRGGTLYLESVLDLSQ